MWGADSCGRRDGKEGGGDGTSVNRATRRQLQVWPLVSARVSRLLTGLLAAAEPGAAGGVLGADAEARLSPEQNAVRLTAAFFPAPVKTAGGSCSHAVAVLRGGLCWPW